jgi:hypothetical protein
MKSRINGRSMCGGWRRRRCRGGESADVSDVHGGNWDVRVVFLMLMGPALSTDVCQSGSDLSGEREMLWLGADATKKKRRKEDTSIMSREREITKIREFCCGGSN